MTLNIAHGRGKALNQVLVPGKTVAANLSAVSRVLQRSNADIVALQEVDLPSLWSGRFDHVEHIASLAGYPWKHHGSHARSWLFNYGTAILSRLPLSSTHSRAFSPTPPTFRKGMVLGQVHTTPPGHGTRSIDVVSVHLDFLRPKTRAAQTEEMIEVLASRRSPCIVLGDLNCEWHGKHSPARLLSRRLGLHAYQPDARSMPTHQHTRLDWILLSPELGFRSYSVLPDKVSDHQAVVAEIEFRGADSDSQ